MSAHEVITGMYAAWIALGLAVVPLAAVACLMVRGKSSGAAWIAGGICSVWIGSAWILQPWGAYVRHELFLAPDADLLLAEHPLVVVAVAAVLTGGIMISRGLTVSKFGNWPTMVISVLTACGFAAGVAYSRLTGF